MEATKGKIIAIDYEGKLEDGTLFDTSKGEGRKPLEFELGAGMVIPGFDKAVTGMKKGEEKEFTLEPEDAYGNYNEELKKPIPKASINMDKDPEPGMVLMMQTPQGQQVPLKIDAVTKDEIIVDMNHPLAGKKLIFNIKVIEIRDKTAEDEKAPKGHDDHECNCEEGKSCGDNCLCEDKKEEKPAKEESIEDLAEGK